VIASGLYPDPCQGARARGVDAGAARDPRPVLIYTMPERAQDEGAADVLRLCEAGRLLHVIGARFPLERIVETHEAQESGKVTGKE